MAQAVEEDSKASYFQHYFHNHMNNLPSRVAVNSSYGRRLSQCREEDEDEDAKKKSLEEQGPLEDCLQRPSNSDVSQISGSDKSLSESSTGLVFRIKIKL